MDVLAYHNPAIDWTRFQQGGISDGGWQIFGEIVQLSWAWKHWDKAAQAALFSRPPAPLYRESDYMRRKRKQEWQRSIDRLKGHKMGAAFLAAERVNALGAIGSRQEGTPDWYLSLAIYQSLGPEFLHPYIGHERANFAVLAFAEFDAGIEVTENPGAVASRWRAADNRAAA
ncbi:MAG: hypothetical protein WBP94_04555 [Rhodomicrobiaceae bacterium]